MEIAGKVAILLHSKLNLSFFSYGVFSFLALARAQRRASKKKAYCIERNHSETIFLFDLVCCIKKNSSLIFVM